jgi:hypothetical protein
MASISFLPANSGQAAIESADFEGGFTVTQNGNVFNFTGTWNCPVNNPPATYTQNMICVCLDTGNCAVISGSFTFSSGNATITGSMTVSTTSTGFGSSGIAGVVRNGSGIAIFASGSNAPGSYLSAPFLLGHIGQNTF